MNILFLNRLLPHAHVRDSGGQDRYQTMRALAETHQVSTISMVTSADVQQLNTLNFCQHNICVPFLAERLSARLWRLGWRLARTRVYGRNISLRYLWQLKRLLQLEQFDIVIVDGMMTWYRQFLGDCVTILDAVDLFGNVAYHYYRQSEGHLTRRYLHWDWLRTVAAEIKYANQYHAILTRSDKDRTILSDLLTDVPIQLLYPWFEGLDTLRHLPPIRPVGNQILFMGAMNIPANIDAAVWFAREVLPVVRREISDATFVIAGANPTEAIWKLGDDEAIIVTGEVDDLTPIYDCATINVVPLATGGGIIVKTLNGLAAARPTVATPTGTAGTMVNNGEHLLIAPRNPQLFAQAVVNLLQDKQLWERLALAGRAHVLEAFTWEQNINWLNKLLDQLTR